MSGQDRTLLVDASVWITLSAVNSCGLLRNLDGRVKIPVAVANEIETDPGVSELTTARGDWVKTAEPIVETRNLLHERAEYVEKAASHLGVDETDAYAGDVALLALALREPDSVVVTDDRPLRKTCKALSVSVSGSIGVLVRSVETGELPADEARERLYAMDEIGARLSASLVKRAEKLIDDASD